MDTLTHALSGALAARATASADPGPGELPVGRRVAIGFLAAAFPDSDFVLRFVDLLTYLNEHRGVTHSLIMLPLWTALLAGLAWLLDRRRRPWMAYVGVIALGIAVHIAGDVITAYGTRVLAPVSDLRVSLPTTFIIDPYFTAIIIAGLILAFWGRAARRAAQAALAVLGLYVGFQALQLREALTLARDYAVREGMSAARVYALPQPLSPFNWKLLVETDDEYREARVNLGRDRPRQAEPDDGWFDRIDASYLPASALQWERHHRYGSGADTAALARDAWDHDALAPLRRFAMYPVMYDLRSVAGTTCASFVDLRFTLTERTPPFRFAACRDGSDSGWRLELVP